MKRLTRLPTIPLVPAESVERLQAKFREAKAANARERYWLAIQESKQSQYVTTWPVDGTGSPIEDDFYGPIG